MQKSVPEYSRHVMSSVEADELQAARRDIAQLPGRPRLSAFDKSNYKAYKRPQDGVMLFNDGVRKRWMSKAELLNRHKSQPTEEVVEGLDASEWQDRLDSAVKEAREAKAILLCKKGEVAALTARILCLQGQVNQLTSLAEQQEQALADKTKEICDLKDTLDQQHLTDQDVQDLNEELEAMETELAVQTRQMSDMESQLASCRSELLAESEILFDLQQEHHSLHQHLRNSRRQANHLYNENMRLERELQATIKLTARLQGQVNNLSIENVSLERELSAKSQQLYATSIENERIQTELDIKATEIEGIMVNGAKKATAYKALQDQVAPVLDIVTCLSSQADLTDMVARLPDVMAVAKSYRQKLLHAFAEQNKRAAQQAREAADSKCQICFEGEAELVLPCDVRHKLCVACASSMDKCPFCRAGFTMVVPASQLSDE